jgi:DNA-binding GntR family transcriptional regulator
MMDTVESLSLLAETAIRDGIIRGRFAFGERLSDRNLAIEIGISRTPVREALARLAQEKLVVVRPQSGTFVMSATPQVVRAVCAMRSILECGALRLAAGQDPEALAAAVSIPLAGGGLAMEEEDLARAEAMDSAFHNALVAAAGNDLLSRAYRSIADQVEAIRHRLPRDIGRMRDAVRQHRRIIDLAVTGRLVDAEAELSSHVRNVERLSITLNQLKVP